MLEVAIPREIAVHDFGVEHVFPAIGPRSILLNARRFSPEATDPNLILLVLQDVTDLKRAEVALQAVEMHRGTVDVHSAGLGRGSEFTVRLPVLLSPASQAPEAPARPAKSVRGWRVLVVE